MMKKFISMLIILCVLSSASINAVCFSDVNSDSRYYDAITALSQNGIINGYEDNTFKPNGTITRAEAAAIIVRAAGLPAASGRGIYRDVSDEYWAAGYIAAATKAGFINGTGNGRFAPDSNVTYNQIIKIIVCVAGLQNDAVRQGGWPAGFVKAAYDNSIIDEAMYRSISAGAKGDHPATRQDTALFIYNTLFVKDMNSVYVGNKKLWLGMDAKMLAQADAVLPSTAGFDWYVYGTATYKDFYAVGIDYTNTVVAVMAAGEGFEYKGHRGGEILYSNEKALYTDSNDSNRLHSVFLLADAYKGRGTAPSEQQLLGEAKMNFHLTNAFRVMHSCAKLIWSDKAAKSAQLHSADMANNNYFSHSSLDGTSMSERMKRQGIEWRSCAENISAGTVHRFGFDSYNSWINSSGHRQNILGDREYLGVGIVYNAGSDYTYYHTQNFYSGL